MKHVEHKSKLIRVVVLTNCQRRVFRCRPHTQIKSALHRQRVFFEKRNPLMNACINSIPVSDADFEKRFCDFPVTDDGSIFIAFICKSHNL